MKKKTRFLIINFSCTKRCAHKFIKFCFMYKAVCTQIHQILFNVQAVCTQIYQILFYVQSGVYTNLSNFVLCTERCVHKHSCCTKAQCGYDENRQNLQGKQQFLN